MTKQVNFEISIEGVALSAVASKLATIPSLKVMPYSMKEMGKDAFDPNHILCIARFPDSLALELAVGQSNSLRMIDGVEEDKMLSVSTIEEKMKKPWYNHFMIPILISTAVNSLGVFGILVAANVNLDWKIYLALFLPGATSFWVAVLYKHYRNAFL